MSDKETYEKKTASLEKWSRILRYALNVPAIIFLLVAIFVLKGTGWVIASASVLFVTLLTTNVFVMQVYKRREEAARQAQYLPKESVSEESVTEESVTEESDSELSQ